MDDHSARNHFPPYQLCPTLLLSRLLAKMKANRSTELIPPRSQDFIFSHANSTVLGIDMLAGIKSKSCIRTRL